MSEYLEECYKQLLSSKQELTALLSMKADLTADLARITTRLAECEVCVEQCELNVSAALESVKSAEVEEEPDEL